MINFKSSKPFFKQLIWDLTPGGHKQTMGAIISYTVEGVKTKREK